MSTPNSYNISVARLMDLYQLVHALLEDGTISYSDLSDDDIETLHNAEAWLQECGVLKEGGADAVTART